MLKPCREKSDLRQMFQHETLELENPHNSIHHHRRFAGDVLGCVCHSLKRYRETLLKRRRYFHITPHYFPITKFNLLWRNCLILRNESTFTPAKIRVWRRASKINSRQMAKSLLVRRIFPHDSSHHEIFIITFKLRIWRKLFTRNFQKKIIFVIESRLNRKKKKISIINIQIRSPPPTGGVVSGYLQIISRSCYFRRRQ